MKNYTFQFTANPQLSTGLSPTFTYFFNIATGATLPGPGVTEMISGSGVYRFQYEPVEATPVYFLIDGGAALSPDETRYRAGNLDTIQQTDLVLGFTNAAFGSTAVDPATVMGYLKRSLELWEGKGEFDKQTGQWIAQTRGGTALFSRVFTNTAQEVNKG